MTPNELRTIIKTTGLTQPAFAARIGVSVKTVEAWLAGTRRPSGSALRAIESLRDDRPALRLSDHLTAAAAGWDELAAQARAEQHPEDAARADRLAAHMRRLASNHRLGVLWDGDADEDPTQIP